MTRKFVFHVIFVCVYVVVVVMRGYVYSICAGESYNKLKVLPQRKCNAAVGIGLSTTGDCLLKSILGFVCVYM